MTLTKGAFAMIHEKRFYFRFRLADIGPGGWKCACCAPPKGEPRKTYCRNKKRGKENQFFRQYIESTLKTQG